MSFDWNEYLQIAQYFKEISLKKPIPLPEEAIHRAGVSRAYYAAFCLCRNVAKSYGFSTTKEESIHLKLVEFYRKRNSKLARQLDCIRIWRGNCDYDDNLKKSSFTMLDESIKTAIEIIQTLQQKKYKEIFELV